MSPSSPPDRTRVILVVLAGACVVVGLMWGLRWVFEDRVVAGRLSPEASLEAMADFVAMLQALAAMIAALLTALLAWIARRTRETRQWPPSGRWPAPRAIADLEIQRYTTRLHAGAVVSGAAAIAALAAALG
jgi:NADH:ubiquinone oxidoreductase subunit 5 (subunit L)/multisubunit Na+/H+ antiporter MnhA subunit